MDAWNGTFNAEESKNQPDDKRSDGRYGAPPYPGDDPNKAPGPEWEKKDRNWYNPETDESLSPDLKHPEPYGPHWDWKKSSGKWYRLYPDGRVEPK